MGAISVFLGRRPFVFALVFSAIPYVGLRFYVDCVMHAPAAAADAPGF